MFGIGTSELIIILILAKEGITKEIGVAAKDIGSFIHEEDNGEKD